MTNNYQYTYHKEIKCAEVTDVIHNIKALTFERTPTAAVVAYLAARYSRSALSIVETYNELLTKDIKVVDTNVVITEKQQNKKSEVISEKQLEAIFHGYGHKSVGDQAELIICLENIPQYTIEVLFNWIPVIAGQVRSTRYQDFTVNADEHIFVDIPEYLNIPKSWIDDYKDLLNGQLVIFKELLEITKEMQGEVFGVTDESSKEVKVTNKSRSLDTARYLLPMGLRTSAALFISATQLCDIIGTLLGSTNVYNVATGKLLLNLVTNPEYDYNKQAASLIRHTKPKLNNFNIDSEIFNIIDCENLDPIYEHKKDPLDSVVAESACNYYHLFTHAIQLRFPRISDIYFIESDEAILTGIVNKIGEAIFNTNRFDLPGPISQTGTVGFFGLMDIGSARDLNRHRSAKRFFAYLSDIYPTVEDLEDENISAKYTLCPYLYHEELQDLKVTYEEVLTTYYFAIQRLIIKGKNLNISETVLNEFTKYLLPMAHLVNYSFYTDYKNLIYTSQLRVAPGGHIAYREIVYKWVEELTDDCEFFSPLLLNLPYPDRFNSEQYFDRS